MMFKQIIRFGKYTEDQKTRLIDYINQIVIDEKNEYEVSIKGYKQSKSLDQLGYYFSAIVPQAMEWQGLIKDHADMWLRNKMVEPKHVEIMGEIFEVRPSIAKMKLNEMSKYIDDCVNFLGLHGQYVPPPTYKKG